MKFIVLALTILSTSCIVNDWAWDNWGWNGDGAWDNNSVWVGGDDWNWNNNWNWGRRGPANNWNNNWNGWNGWNNWNGWNDWNNNAVTVAPSWGWDNWGWNAPAVATVSTVANADPWGNVTLVGRA
jgi:hypothetical protein